jgi:hypothetical protein
MAKDDGDVKPKRLGTRAWNRLRSLRERGTASFDSLKFEPRESVARLLEELGQLHRQGLVTIGFIMGCVHDDENAMPRIYEEYLRSPEWQIRRAEALDDAGHHCQVCNSVKQLDVHHRTYERLGFEEPADVVVLCRVCHEIFHRQGRLSR